MDTFPIVKEEPMLDESENNISDDNIIVFNGICDDVEEKEENITNEDYLIPEVTIKEEEGFFDESLNVPSQVTDETNFAYVKTEPIIPNPIVYFSEPVQGVETKEERARRLSRARKKRHRDNLQIEKLLEIRGKDRIRKAEARKNLPLEKVLEIREENRIRKAEARKNLPFDKVLAIREQNRVAAALRRKSESEAEREAKKQENREKKAAYRRAQKVPEEAEAMRKINEIIAAQKSLRAQEEGDIRHLLEAMLMFDPRGNIGTQQQQLDERLPQDNL